MFTCHERERVEASCPRMPRCSGCGHWGWNPKPLDWENNTLNTGHFLLFWDSCDGQLKTSSCTLENGELCSFIITSILFLFCSFSCRQEKVSNTEPVVVCCYWALSSQKVITPGRRELLNRCHMAARRPPHRLSLLKPFASPRHTFSDLKLFYGTSKPSNPRKKVFGI